MIKWLLAILSAILDTPFCLVFLISNSLSALANKILFKSENSVYFWPPFTATFYYYFELLYIIFRYGPLIHYLALWQGSRRSVHPIFYIFILNLLFLECSKTLTEFINLSNLTFLGWKEVYKNLEKKWVIFMSSVEDLIKKTKNWVREAQSIVVLTRHTHIFVVVDCLL